MAEVEAKGSICGRYLPARYVLAILGSFAMGITYALKVNMSIAMVAMLNHTAIKNMSAGHVNQISDEECEGDISNGTSVTQDGPFLWSESLQGLILSSYFWGYLVFQIPGGMLAEEISAKWTMFGSVGINIVCTILTPCMANLHYSALIVMRVCEGIGGAVTFPAMHVLLARWAPPSERSFMSSIVYAGTCLGTVISILVAGVIAGSLGWETVFYIMGSACALWMVFWMFLVQDSPHTQKYISKDERDFILNSLGLGNTKTKRVAKVPWKSVFTSKPFWAIMIAHICSNWGWYMLLIELPFYMNQVLKFKIDENAVLSSIPYFFMWLFSMFLSKTLDYLRAKRSITTTTARKLATMIASVIPGLILFTVSFIGCQRWLAVGLMILAVTCKGAMFCGFLSNHIDIAPNFAGTLVALTNTVATIPGIVVPIFVGYLTHGNQTIQAWSIIFFVTVGLYIIEIVTYYFFGSGEEQSWNKLGEDSHEAQPINQTNKAYQATDK